MYRLSVASGKSLVIWVCVRRPKLEAGLEMELLRVEIVEYIALEDPIARGEDGPGE